MPTLKETAQKIGDQIEARRTWEEAGPIHTSLLIAEETAELVDAIEMYDFTCEEGVMGVVSEIGDVLYTVLTLCHQLGINPDDAVEMKMVRNAFKYPDAIQNNGFNASEAKEVSKDLYSHLGGDRAFFEWYSENYPERDNGGA